MGQVKAEVILDEEPLLFSGNSEQLAEFYNKQKDDYRAKNAGGSRWIRRPRANASAAANTSSHWCGRSVFRGGTRKAEDFRGRLHYSLEGFR